MYKLLLFILVIPFLGCIQKKSSKTEKETESEKPNVVILLADDLGYSDVGFNGCKDILTPNIDKIAENGIKFEQAYVTEAFCAPSRASILTGRYQQRFGFHDNPKFNANDINEGMSLDEETLADVLGKVGYKSICVGKWHLGAHDELEPLKRGFTDFYGFLAGGHNYFPEMLTVTDKYSITKEWPDGYSTKLVKNTEYVDENEYITDALSREAVNFIEREKDNPFFVYLAYNAPHTPMHATEKYLSRFKNIEDEHRRTYAAMVSAVDDGVGRVMNKLEELGLTDNTLVVFLSDNGGQIRNTPDNNGSINLPLRGSKGMYYEGGFRVPMAMQWPEMLPENEVYSKPVSSMDIFATAVNYAQANPKNPLDGVNLVPYVNGENKGEPHEKLYWQLENRFAARIGEFKLVKEKDTEELYNLATDIGESNPLLDDTSYKQLKVGFGDWEEDIK